MKKSNRIYIIVGVLSIVLLLLTILVKLDVVSSIDEIVSSALLRNDSLTNIMKIISKFGDTGVYIIISILIFLILKDKKDGILLPINLMLIVILNRLFKELICRTRPFGAIVKVGGYSFPSGHSSSSIVFYGFIIYIVYKNIENKIIRNILIGVLSLLILLIGISRVYLKVHYPSDVLGGYLFGLIYLLLCINFFKDYRLVKD